MASGYQINGVDLDDLCEAKLSSGNSALTTDPNSSTTMMNYYNNNEHFGNRYSRANTDSWAKTIQLPFYGKGYPFKVIQKGCLPTQTKFAELTSAGNFSISKTDSALNIGSTSYPASSFRGGVVPKYIGVMFCGGGGGAGGFGADEGDKNGYTVTPGGAGSGGGVQFVVVNTSLLYQITIGSGGGAGGEGSCDSRPSNGSSGGAGGDSILWFQGGSVYAGGGKGGNPGRGSSGSHPEQSTGGYSSNTNYDGELDSSEIVIVRSVTGGVGGSPGRNIAGGGCSATSFSFSNGAGIDSTTMFNNSSTGVNYSSGDMYKDSWAGGGCSIGTGGTSSVNAQKGGGGCSGHHYSRVGATGYCAFYY